MGLKPCKGVKGVLVHSQPPSISSSALQCVTVYLTGLIVMLATTTAAATATAVAQTAAAASAAASAAAAAAAAGVKHS